MSLIEPPVESAWTCPNETCAEHGIVKPGFAPPDATVLCGTCATPCTYSEPP